MSTGEGMIIGGPVTPEIDAKIISIAKFAVDEYNKNEKATLEFVKVVEVQPMMLYPVFYGLILEAIDGGQTKKYQAKVEEKVDKDLPPYDTGAGWSASHTKLTLLEFYQVGEGTNDGNEGIGKSADK